MIGRNLAGRLKAASCTLKDLDAGIRSTRRLPLPCLEPPPNEPRRGYRFQDKVAGSMALGRGHGTRALSGLAEGGVRDGALSSPQAIRGAAIQLFVDRSPRLGSVQSGIE